MVILSYVALRLGRCALSSTRHGIMVRSFTRLKAAAGFSYPGARSLEQIVKLELLENEPTPQIRRIWEDFHANKHDAVATTLQSQQFYALVQRAEAAPYFIFPVYRQKGFFNLLCQFQQSCFLVTYLDAFKENPSAAPPCVAVSLYDNMVADKELALVRGDIINMLDKKESQLLLQQLLATYHHDALYDHVDKFNNRPDQFDFEAYRLLLKDITGPATEE